MPQASDVAFLHGSSPIGHATARSRWHRRLIVRKWTSASQPRRRGIFLEIRRLVERMAEENPTWGYARIQGALKNVGQRMGRSTIRRILEKAGLPPVPHRPTSWQKFLKAHWGVIAGGLLHDRSVDVARVSDVRASWAARLTCGTLRARSMLSRRTGFLVGTAD